MRRLMQPLLLFALTLAMSVAVQHGGVPLAQAGALNAIGSGWNPTNITPGQSANFTLQIFDDNGTTGVRIVANGPGYWQGASIPGCAAAPLISPDGKTLDLQDTLCDDNTTPNAYLASLILACSGPGDISATITTPGAAGGTAFAPGVTPFNTTVGGLTCLPPGSLYGQLVPSQGALNTPFHFTGGGFGPNEPLDVFVKPPTSSSWTNLTGTSRSDTDGKFDVPIILANDVPLALRPPAGGLLDVSVCSPTICVMTSLRIFRTNTTGFPVVPGGGVNRQRCAADPLLPGC